MSQTSNIVIIGVVILISILIVPAILGRETIFEKIINGIWDKLLELRDMLFEDLGTGGETSVGLTFEYVDGTTEYYTPDNMTFAVYYGEKRIQTIWATTIYKLTWDESELTFKTLDIHYTLRIYFDDEQTKFAQGVDIGVTDVENGKWTMTKHGALILTASEIVNLDNGELKSHKISFESLIPDAMVTFVGEQPTQYFAESTSDIEVTVTQAEATLETSTNLHGLNIYSRPFKRKNP